MPECPICTTPLHGTILRNIDNWTFECSRCGNVCIHGQPMLFGTALGRVFLNLPDLTSLRRRSQASHILRRQARPNQLNVVSVQAITEWPLDDPLPSVLEQLDELIRWTGTEQITPDIPVRIRILAVSAHLGTLINSAADYRAFKWLVEQPRARELITVGFPRMEGDFEVTLQLTIQGWEYFGQLQRSTQQSRIVFMAMKFDDPDLDTVVHRCFRPAVDRAGFELRLVSDKQPAGLIDDQLRVALRASRLVIADLTHGSNGAYWEGGFAEGLGRPVIYTCRKDVWAKQKTHFDTNHLATIIWNPESLDDAGMRLTDMIRATLPGEARLTD